MIAAGTPLKDAPATQASLVTSALLADRSTKVREVVRRQLNYLGTAIAAAINVLNPEVVVLGGFLANLAAYDRTPLDVRQVQPASTR